MPGYLVSPIYNASSVGITPTGDISATTAQAAIAELDTEKAPKSSPTFTGNAIFDTNTLFVDATNDSVGVGTTSPANGFKLDVNGGIKSNIITNSQSASYTLVLLDHGKLVEMNVASANNLTVPLNSSVAFPIGTQITILQINSGQTTIVPISGVTVNATPGLKLRTQWSSATLIKRATDTWVAIGDLVA